MKAEELRIGNHIQNGVVVGLTKDAITVFDGYSTWPSDKMKEPFEPIPLTPEILEKAGFVDTKADGYYERAIDLPDLIHSVSKVLYLSTNGTDGWAVYLRDEYIALIHNLHQLQNLYFALTSSELPLNL